MLPNDFGDDIKPSGGVFHVEQANALLRRGVSVSACFLWFRSFRTWRSGHWDGYWGNLVTGFRMEVPFTEIRFWNPGRSEWRRSLRRRFYPVLLRKHAERHGTPDLIHAHFGARVGLAIEAARQRWPGIPVVLTEHSSQVGLRKLDRCEQDLVRCAYREADVVTAVSSHLAEEMRALSKRPVRIIPNFIEPPALHRNSSGPIFRAVSVGWLKPQKRHRDILQAFARLAPHVRIRLDIYGEGSERTALERLAADLKLTHVTFHGSIPKEHIYEALAQSDLLIHASEYETFGCVFIEAMAVGVPVVAAEAPGVRHIIEHGIGMTYPIGDVEALARRIQERYERYDAFDAKRIRRHFSTRYSADAVCAEWLALYQDILSANRAVKRRGA